MADTKPNRKHVTCEPRALNEPPAPPLAGHMTVLRRLQGASPRTLLHGDDGGVVDGLHDGGQAAAQVVGLADVDFGRVFEDHRVCRAVQDSGQELTQLHL